MHSNEIGSDRANHGDLGYAGSMWPRVEGAAESEKSSRGAQGLVAGPLLEGVIPRLRGHGTCPSAAPPGTGRCGGPATPPPGGALGPTIKVAIREHLVGRQNRAVVTYVRLRPGARAVIRLMTRWTRIG